MEAATKGKKGKPAATDEPEVRMITPEPILLEKERGREFTFEMGRYEQVRVDQPKTVRDDKSNIEGEGPEDSKEDVEPVYER